MYAGSTKQSEGAGDPTSADGGQTNGGEADTKSEKKKSDGPVEEGQVVSD